MLYSFPIIRPSFRRIVALDVQMGYQTSLITVWERRNISNFILVLKKNVLKPAFSMKISDQFLKKECWGQISEVDTFPFERQISEDP